MPLRGDATATSATMAATSSAAMGWNRPGESLTVLPSALEAATPPRPPWRRMETVFEPIRPVPPITTIFILDFSLLSQRADLALDEGEKVGIDHVGMRRAHAMRELLVDLQGALPEELRGEQRGIGDRDDLVVVAVHDEGRLVDDLQVLGEVGLREGSDAVVMRLRAAHHAQAHYNGIRA